MIPYAYRIDTAFTRPTPRPRASGWLEVGGPHSIWWEETGPVDGLPVVVVHGGPGGFIKPYYRRLLDPARHRGIFFDQRGCGRSRPSAELAENSTWALVEDMEALRAARGIDRWIVLGGSWGSTLALTYAQAHPSRVAGLLLSGVFLARAEDLAWWWSGVRQVFPDVVAARDSLLTAAERADPRAAFLRRVLDPDPAVSGPAAMVLGAAEGQTLDLWPAPPPDDPDALDPQELASARVFAHYDANDYFLTENQLIEQAGRLSGVPGAIVAGRSDMCTPPKGAWDLAQAWPDARLTIVAAAGHRWSDETLGRVVVSELARLSGF
ncbi:alpha/beta fold hydrolase [Phenylobacterium sp.]|uniref:alpha/beta fold hydrolase n=1 Tax=Phenylobacterium sp. TaxID=1871053 RepID=UPI0035ADEC70